MTTKKTGIFWFRRDLRLSDNPGLRQALDDCDALIPVYIDTREDEGAWQPGAASLAWLHKSLAELDASLADKESRLILRSGKTLETLHALIEETKASAVYWNRLYDPAIVARDRVVKQSLTDAGISVCSCKAHVLREPWEVKTQSGDPYRVFTPYWRKARELPPPREPLVEPRAFRAPRRWPSTLKLAEFEYEPDIAWDTGFWEHWEPGEEGARKRLRNFVRAGLAGYDESRDLPAEDGVSRLSPHLHFGELSPFQVWKLVSNRRSNVKQDVESYLSEIGWREFAHHILFHFPKTTDEPMHEKYAGFPWRDDYRAMLKAWQRGRTGIPIVDAGMRQLWKIGWMHNRVRMIVASLLVKNIRAPWQEGAKWFWDTLVDADLAANSMGWQWSAGSGADAAPYFRIFNPVRQGERFDPDGAYVRRWVPELASIPDKWIHQPWEIPNEEAGNIGFRPGEDYPLPILDLSTTRKEALAALQSIK